MTNKDDKKKLFLIGPGFIGGTLLLRLQKERPDLELSALTRRDEQAKQLSELGITPIKGGLNDALTIKKAASEADIIIHTATADDAPSAFAVVDGIKSRSNKDKKQIYIQTSGNDELAFSAKKLAGTSIKERTLSDAKGDEVLETDRIQPDAYHRHVDGPLRERLFNSEAEKENNVSTTIMMPPLIFGVSPKPWERISIQIPMLASTMIKKGFVTLPDGFDGAWNCVHVDDLVGAYLALLKQLEEHKPGEPQPSHYMFPAAADTFPWKNVFDTVIEQLQKHGVKGEISTLADKTKFEDWLGPENPYAPCFAQIVFGKDNSYTTPDRLKSLGFKHKHNEGPVQSITQDGELEQHIQTELQGQK